MPENLEARRDNGDDVTLTDCYYFQTLGSAQGSQAYRVTSDEHVNMQVGEPNEAYDVSGINVFHQNDNEFIIYNFITYDGVIYSAKDNLVRLYLSQNGAPPDGYQSNKFIVSSGSFVNFDPCYLKMPNTNVTISLAPADFATGHDGTNADPYLIYTEEQWMMLVSRVNNGENGGYKDKHFRLMSDIKLKEAYTGGNSSVMMGAQRRSVAALPGGRQQSPADLDRNLPRILPDRRHL